MIILKIIFKILLTRPSIFSSYVSCFIITLNQDGIKQQQMPTFGY